MTSQNPSCSARWSLNLDRSGLFPQAYGASHESRWKHRADEFDRRATGPGPDTSRTARPRLRCRPGRIRSARVRAEGDTSQRRHSRTDRDPDSLGDSVESKPASSGVPGNSPGAVRKHARSRGSGRVVRNRRPLDHRRVRARRWRHASAPAALFPTRCRRCACLDNPRG